MSRIIVVLQRIYGENADLPLTELLNLSMKTLCDSNILSESADAGQAILPAGLRGDYESKYIVDIVGNLPVILMELDAADNPMDIKKKYIYAHGQVLAQHDIGPQQDDMYFYLHDRLGSVRQIIEYDEQAKAGIERCGFIS